MSGRSLGGGGRDRTVSRGHDRASKTWTLSPKVGHRDPRGRQKRVPFAKKCVKNAYPGAESRFRSVTPRNPEMIADPNGIDFGTKTYRFGHFSGPSYRGAHACWPAARLGGTSKPLIIWDTKGHENASSAEGGRRRDEPGKEKVEFKNCFALVVF